MMTDEDLAEMEKYMPANQNILVEWCALHTLHVAAYEAGRYREAAKLADQKYLLWVKDRQIAEADQWYNSLVSKSTS